MITPIGTAFAQQRDRRGRCGDLPRRSCRSSQGTRGPPGTSGMWTGAPFERRPASDAVAAGRRDWVRREILSRIAHRTWLAANVKRRPRSRKIECMFGLAETRRRLDDGVEHRLQLAGRAADDVEHVAGRGLVLERLRQLARARLHLLEQPRVLDGDHGLVGEGLKQGDLSLSEELSLGAAKIDRADRDTFSHQRHAESVREHPASARARCPAGIRLPRSGGQRRGQSARQAPLGH